MSTVRVPASRQHVIVDPHDPSRMVAVTSDGKLQTTATLQAESITIGAVKLQDANSANEAGVNTNGQLAVQNPPNLDAATSTLAKESGGNLAGIKSDTDTIASQLDAKTSTLAKETGGNLAAIKSDADTIVTNTGKLDVNLSTRLKPGDFPLETSRNTEARCEFLWAGGHTKPAQP